MGAAPIFMRVDPKQSLFNAAALRRATGLPNARRSLADKRFLEISHAVLCPQHIAQPALRHCFGGADGRVGGGAGYLSLRRNLLTRRDNFVTKKLQILLFHSTPGALAHRYTKILHGNRICDLRSTPVILA